MHRFWPKDRYFISLVIVFAFVMIQFFVPKLIQNEAARLLPARRLVDPSFFEGSAGTDLSILFSSLLAPLWLLLKDALAVALVGRVLLWILLLYSLVKFAKELEIKWYSFAIGLGIWLYGSSGQNLVAGESLFGGVQNKGLAYAFIFLSLTSLLRYQSVRAGIFCGIAISSHVLIGGWAAIAMTGALLIGLREYGLKSLITFTLSAAVVGLPVMLIATRYVILGSSVDLPIGQGMDVNALYVLVANPFHQDPNYFLSTGAAIKVAVFSICTFYAVTEILPRVKAKLLLSFLGILLAIFVAGVVARQFEILWFLKYFPFRVGDLLVPLVFWLVVPGLLIQRVRLLIGERQFVSRLPAYHIFFTLLISAVVLWNFSYALPHFRDSLIKFPRPWLLYSTRAESPFEEMAHWIRDHTKKSAIVIAHPCGPRRRSTFPITAERATVVSYKEIPANKQLFEWYRRMILLNGNREFTTVGWGLCDELNENFPTLELQQLLFIQQTTGADYYLTTGERADLKEGLIHHNKEYYFYNLTHLQGTPPVPS